MAGPIIAAFRSMPISLDENDISREGHSPLLEVPMSIQYKHSAWMNSVKQGYDRLRGKVRSPPYTGCDRWAAMWRR